MWQQCQLVNSPAASMSNSSSCAGQQESMDGGQWRSWQIHCSTASAELTQACCSVLIRTPCKENSPVDDRYIHSLLQVLSAHRLALALFCPF